MLADAYLRLGEPEAALQAVREALELAERERSAFYEPELHRLWSLALDAHGRRRPARSRRRSTPRSTSRAARGRARSSCGSRSRQAAYWGRTGRAAAGRAAVAAAYSWFTEGLETPDLRAAAALLGRETARPT